MNDVSGIAPSPSPSLIGADDPPAYEFFNPHGTTPLLLICDHANPAIPGALGNLGLSAELLDRHIAYDIGAANVARALSRRLNAPAMLSGYSRLLIDCNRAPGDPGSIPPNSDDVAIPGNRELDEAGQMRRIETFFWPYHHAITNAMAHLWRLGRPPALFSIHSFTPTLDDEDRYWDIGVLWNRDSRMARPLIDLLRAPGDILVGDNEPYSGLDIAYSLDLHAGAAGLPNCAVEIRQDHLETAEGARHWADVLGDAFERVLAIDGLHRVENY